MGLLIMWKPKPDDIVTSEQLISNEKEIKQENNKLQRNEKLNKSDWVVIRSLEKGLPIPEKWETYRQALRDIDIKQENIDWPESP